MGGMCTDHGLSAYWAATDRLDNTGSGDCHCMKLAESAHWLGSWLLMLGIVGRKGGGTKTDASMGSS